MAADPTMARGALMLSPKLMLCTIMPHTVHTSTDLTMPPGMLDLSPEPATSQFIVSTKGRLMLMLTPATCTPPTTMELTDIPLTATDTAWPELLLTQEPPPPSLPGAPRDSARGALMPSQDTSLTHMPTVSPQCPTPPTAMDLLATPLV